MLHAATFNFGSLMAARFFLGIAEATVAPTFALIVGIWYKREEQPLRQGLWFLGNALAGTFSGLIGYGVGHINHYIPQWKYLFIIFGAATVAWAIVMLVFLPDGPRTASFLTPRQRAIAYSRVHGNAGKKVTHWKRYQVFEVFKDPQVYLLFFYTFCINFPNGGLTSVSIHLSPDQLAPLSGSHYPCDGW
jgi:MFS family permease